MAYSVHKTGIGYAWTQASQIGMLSTVLSFNAAQQQQKKHNPTHSIWPVNMYTLVWQPG